LWNQPPSLPAQGEQRRSPIFNIPRDIPVARAGVVAINAKALESLTANVEANFDFVKSTFGVGGLADYVALQSEFARARLDAVADQAKAIDELAQKTTLDALEPIKAQVAKSFKLAL